MKIYDVIQNTPEWHSCRLGKLTASAFDKLITAVKGEPSKQAEDYCNQLVAEILTGSPTDDFKGNVWTERGHELEPQAIAAYAMIRENAEVSHGCFVSNDAETYGASPDNFVQIPIIGDVTFDVTDPETGEITGQDSQPGVIGYDEGLLEIKCFMPKHHIKMALKPEVEREHWPQLQGQLLVTGRKWVDIMFYHPALQPVIIRVERDEEYIVKLIAALDAAVANIQSKVKLLRGEAA